MVIARWHFLDEKVLRTDKLGIEIGTAKEVALWIGRTAGQDRRDDVILEEALSAVSRPADDEALSRIDLSGAERLICDLDPVAEMNGSIDA